MLYKGSRLRLHRPGQGQDIGRSLRGLLKGGGGGNMAGATWPPPWMKTHSLSRHKCTSCMLALIVRTYCMLYVLTLKNST